MPTTHLTASIRVVRGVLDAAEAGGVERAELLTATGIDPDVLDDVDGRVPYGQLAKIYEEAVRLTGDGAFGLHTAERIPEGGLGVLEYVLYSSPNLGTAYDYVCRYFRLLVDGVDVHFEVGDTTARFSHRFPPSSPPPPRHAQEFVMAGLLVFGRRASGVDWVPLRVTFPHEAPEDTSEHERLFGVLPTFGAPAAEIVFDKTLLEAPLVKADPVLLGILDRHAQALLKELPEDESIVYRTRVLISKQLRGTAPALEEVAGELGLSARTLQRRLKDEGTSLQALLDEIRHELALRFLHDPTITISEVAFLLGFSEPSAFYRAFRRWTGVTPSEYRQHAA